MAAEPSRFVLRRGKQNARAAARLPLACSGVAIAGLPAATIMPILFSPQNQPEPLPMPSPADLRFSESHEWFRLQGDVVTLGISQFAADELTDITYVELKPVGTQIQAGSTVGEVESVKTTSDVYSVVGGSIIEVNTALKNDPGALNSDPYGKGWLVKIRASDTSPLKALMDAKTYDQRHAVR